MKALLGLLLLLTAPLAGCLVGAEDGRLLGRADKCEFALTLQYIEGSENVNGTGTLRWIELEGGFWGIESDDGRRFQPLGDSNGDVCKALQEDGLRVHFAGRTRPDMGGIHMWGAYVDLTLIERA